MERIKSRVIKMSIAEPIATEGEITSASFTELPVTLKDDAVEFVNEDPEVEETFCNEQDTPINVDYSFKPIKLHGTFIGLSQENKKALLGGTVADKKYTHSTLVPVLEKSLKIELQDGGVIVLPRVRGYVKFGRQVNKKSIDKYPFSFTLLRASADWDCDIYEDDTNKK